MYVLVRDTPLSKFFSYHIPVNPTVDNESHSCIISIPIVCILQLHRIMHIFYHLKSMSYTVRSMGTEPLVYWTLGTVDIHHRVSQAGAVTGNTCTREIWLAHVTVDYQSTVLSKEFITGTAKSKLPYKTRANSTNCTKRLNNKSTD